MTTEKEDNSLYMKKACYAHEDTNMAKGLYLSLIYTLILFIVRPPALPTAQSYWPLCLLSILTTISSTTFFITLVTLLFKGYGYTTKIGYYLHFRFGNRYSTSYRHNYFFLSKKANLFGKFSLFIMVLIVAIMAFMCSLLVLDSNNITFL